MMEAGRIRSTKKFFRSTISSPVSERIPRKAPLATSGQSPQVKVVTMASM